MNPYGRFLEALGIDPAKATDQQPTLLFTGDGVAVHYGGLVIVSTDELVRAVHAAGPQDESKS